MTTESEQPYVPFESYQRDVQALVKEQDKDLSRASTVPALQVADFTASALTVPGAFRREYIYAKGIEEEITNGKETDFDAAYKQPLISSIAAHLNATMLFVNGLDDDSDCGLFEDYTTQELLAKHRGRERQLPKCSVSKTCLSIFKSFIGVGILFLPNAFHFAGWLMSSVMLAISAALSLLGMLKLSACHHLVQSQYSDIGRKAYGNWMYGLISFNLAFSQFCFCTSAMIFIAQTVTNFCDHFHWESPSMASLYATQLLVLCPLGWIRKISAMKYTNLLGDFLIVVAVVYVIYCALLVIGSRGISPTSAPTTSLMASVPFIGTSVYAFEGIALIIPIREAMAEPEKFPKAITFMLAVMAALLGGIALTGNLAWGEATPAVALNAPEMNTSLLVVQFGYIIAICCTFPMVAYPCFTIVEEQFFGGWPRSSKRTFLKNLTRMGLCFLMVLLAMVGGQDLELFISFVGTFCSIPLAFIFPGMLHYKLFNGASWKSDWLLMIVGFALMPVTFVIDVRTALGME